MEVCSNVEQHQYSCTPFFLNGVLFRFRYQVLDYHSSTSALVFLPGSFPLFLRFGWRLDIEAALTCVGNAAI